MVQDWRPFQTPWEPGTLNKYYLCKDVWYPTVFERNKFERWQEMGERHVVARARQRVDELLA